MPKRLPAVPDEVVRREAHLLSDDVPLLPVQVIMVTGLSVGQLQERRRLSPPKPPLPNPREKGRSGVWYSMGTLRAYLAARRELAELDAEIDRRHQQERTLRFSGWLGTPHVATVWPFALVGPHKRPVDLWATIRGEVPMSRTDTTAWLTVEAYLIQCLAATQAEEKAQERAQRVQEATRRQKAALPLAPTRSRAKSHT